MGKGKKGGKGKGKGRGRGEDEESKGTGGATTDLHLAARNGDVEKIGELLAASTEHLNQPDQHRRSPLHMAAFFGKAEAVAMLLEKGADPQLQAMDGFLPLHFAAQQGHVEVLKLLVRQVGNKGHGAVKKHVNLIVSKGKRSALHLALLKGHAECARFLVMKGSSCDAKALELCSSEELKEELIGKAKVVVKEEETKETETKSNVEKVDEAATAEPPVKKQKVDEGSMEVAVIDGLPASAVSMSCLQEAPAGLLACGPWTLEDVKLVDDGEKTYPTGIDAMADVAWEMKVQDEPEEDGTVWCVHSVEVGDKVQLKMKKSSKKLLYYTHVSDEAAMLEKDSRCNACSLMMLLETSDGCILLSKNAERWQVPCCSMSSLELSRLCAEAVQPYSPPGSLGSIRLLGLLEADDAPGGYRHHLIAACRLPLKAEEVAKAKPEVVLMPFREAAASPSGVELKEFMKQQDVSSRAISLLQALVKPPAAPAPA